MFVLAKNAAVAYRLIKLYYDYYIVRLSNIYSFIGHLAMLDLGLIRCQARLHAKQCRVIT